MKSRSRPFAKRCAKAEATRHSPRSSSVSRFARFIASSASPRGPSSFANVVRAATSSCYVRVLMSSTTAEQDPAIRTQGQPTDDRELAKLLALADDVVTRTRKGGADI